jgi:hypothetical protein
MPIDTSCSPNVNSPLEWALSRDISGDITRRHSATVAIEGLNARVPSNPNIIFYYQTYTHTIINIYIM